MAVENDPTQLKQRRKAAASPEQQAAAIPKANQSGWLPAGFAGTGPSGSFFEAPEWVDQQIAAGTTPQAVNTSYVKGYATLAFMFYSPNLVWFAFAVLDYIVFPYELAAAADPSAPAFWRFAAHRFGANLVLTMGYVGFWHVSLYGFGVCTRKFNPRLTPAKCRVLHNMWYTTLGIIQWTVWETCFVHMYASGKMPFVSDSDVVASWAGAARMVAWFFLVPLFRDFHFYFAHRLLHIRCLYKFVHSLHHRNTDIEPFSGLCMHPVEHMYYFACVTPILYCMCSPFAIMWMGMHLLLSPAASHSGWEDHMQSDQYHYLHHAKFECNYGTSGIPFDHWFGTFREKLGQSEQYKGAATADAVTASNPDVPDLVQKDRFRFPGLPSTGMMGYFVVTYIIFAVFLLAFLDYSPNGYGNSIRSFELLNTKSAQLVAVLVSSGPVMVGLAGCVMTRDKMPLRWPFHEDSILGGFGFHVLVGFLFCILPTYHTVLGTLGDRGDSAYCQLWGC